MYDQPIEKIRIENNRVAGVETGSGFQKAELVISNIGLANTIDLAGKEHFPAEYVETSGTYRHSNSYITIKYALDRKVVKPPVVFYMPNLPAPRAFDYIQNNNVPEDPYIFMPVPSNLDETLAPPGNQIVIAGTAAPPNASGKLCEAILDVVHNRVCDLFPDFADAILWQKRSSRSDTTRLIQHPSSCARSGPPGDGTPSPSPKNPCRRALARRVGRGFPWNRNRDGSRKCIELI